MSAPTPARGEYEIWSYEHRAWWRPARFGYTESLAEAGIYTRAEAERIVADANIVAENEIAILAADAQAGRLERRRRPRV
jgi:hypothetical protein